MSQPSQQIFFTGLNISAHKASRLTAKGELERILEGVYVDSQHPNIPDLVREHAPRIALSCFKDTWLSHSSAYYRGAVGREIFLSGRQKAHKTSKYLDIHITPSTGMETNFTHRFPHLKDSLGAFEAHAAGDELIYLQMHERVKAYLSKRLPPKEMEVFTERLLLTYNNAESELIKKLRYVGGTMKMPEHCTTAAIAAVMDFVIRRDSAPAARPTACDLKVYWNHRHVANLSHNGVEWEFGYRKDWSLALSFSELGRSSRLPPFIEALMPENDTFKDDENPFDLRTIQSGIKYLANICITPHEDHMAATPHDVLEGKLINFRDSHGTFTGRLQNANDDAFHEQLGQQVRSVWDDEAAPKISGRQPKVPMTLDKKGNLFAARTTAFTHILKLPGEVDTPREAFGAVEWFCIETCRRSRLSVAQSALVPLPGMPPGLLSERFDIRENSTDRRLIVAEDMCAALGLPSTKTAKYSGTMERVAQKILAHSTQADVDARELLRHVTANWIFANGDYHLKNVSIIKIAKPTLDGWETVKLSPAYDILCTKVFIPDDHFCLPVAAKREDITMNDLMEFARTCKVPKDEAAEIVQETTRAICGNAMQIYQALPDCIRQYHGAHRGVSQSLDIVLHRAATILEEAPEAIVESFIDKEDRPRSRARAA